MHFGIVAGVMSFGVAVALTHPTYLSDLAQRPNAPISTGWQSRGKHETHWPCAFVRYWFDRLVFPCGVQRLGFVCWIVGGAMNTTFSGEMQLAGWSESHTGGCKVTFWLQSPDDLQAFRALTVRKGNTAGQRFMAALVEVGDDEQPIPPQEPEKPKGGPLAKLAGMWCNEPEFLKWFQATDAADAAEGVRVLCEIESRAELDSNPEAAEKFHRLIRGPYQKHLISRGLVA